MTIVNNWTHPSLPNACTFRPVPATGTCYFQANSFLMKDKFVSDLYVFSESQMIRACLVLSCFIYPLPALHSTSTGKEEERLNGLTKEISRNLMAPLNICTDDFYHCAARILPAVLGQTCLKMDPFHTPKQQKVNILLTALNSLITIGPSFLVLSVLWTRRGPN